VALLYFDLTFSLLFVLLLIGLRANVDGPVLVADLRRFTKIGLSGKTRNIKQSLRFSG
jgi:hypothetical protein